MLLKIKLHNLELFYQTLFLSQLLKMKGLKYICILFEFKHIEFFTPLGGYLLNTTL